MSDKTEGKREGRHRTCVDELRCDLARRREHWSDPATRTLLQFLTLFSAALALTQTREPMLNVVRLRLRTRYDPPPRYGLARDAWLWVPRLDPETDKLVKEEQHTPRLLPTLKSWRRLVRELTRRRRAGVS